MNIKQKIKNLVSYFRRAWATSRTYLFVNLIRNIFTASISLINIVGLGTVVDALTSGKSKEDVLQVILVYLSVNLLITLINQALLLWENSAMRKASNVLQYGYMHDCLDVDYHYVQDRKILNLKRKSMNSQPVFSLSVYGECFSYIIQAIGVISIFALLSPIFIGIILVLSAALIWLTIYTQKCDFDFNNDKVEDDRKLTYLYEVMTKYKFAKEIRINNAGAYIENKYKATFMTQIQKLKQLLKKKLGVNLLSVLFSTIQAAIMYLYFTYQVFSSQISIAQYTVMINNSLKAADFYREYEDTLKNNSVLSDSNRLSEIGLDFSTASLKFENVSFCYPGASDFTLKNIDLEIPASKKLGIVGLNGSGKTTLIKLMLRLYTPTEGKITLGGIDISEIPYRQYAKHIGVVLQDFSLFSYSLKENIVFDGAYHSRRLIECIDKSGLSDKIKKLPKGIETSIYRDLDDNGVEFSGGEGQKLAMARAIYKDADMLILDEPSSALDVIAEYELFSRLNEISENKTTVFISHRLSSTLFCDHIVVLSDGMIIEQGDHSSLMQKNGFYANLYHSQAKYYEENGVKIQ